MSKYQERQSDKEQDEKHQILTKRDVRVAHDVC